MHRGDDAGQLDEVEANLDPARRAGTTDDLTRAEIASAAADREAGAAQQELSSALKAGGGAAAHQERAAILEDLAGSAREALVCAIGAATARTALRRLGESRRGPMLADTEAAFHMLTGDVWSLLDTWVHGQDERLVGISEGRSVPTDGMSTGTRENSISRCASLVTPPSCATPGRCPSPRTTFSRASMISVPPPPLI